jgi:ligand-binding sensor domain-containing protein
MVTDPSRSVRSTRARVVARVASVAGGVRRISGGKVELVPDSESLTNPQLWQTADGARWVAAQGNTFRLQANADGRFRLSSPIPAMAGMTLRRQIPARKGGVWLAGDQGVVRLQNDRIVERWTPAQGLSSRFARALYEDAKGVLWVGTYGGGLNRIQNGRVKRYDERNGLFDDTVSCILVDRSGHTWAAAPPPVKSISADAPSAVWRRAGSAPTRSTSTSCRAV